MKEALLHYFWKNKLFAAQNLHTTDLRSVQVIRPGFPHQDAGPDFKQAVLKIDDITWVGDVEIHVRSSDWNRHGHQHDEKYQSVILHVVYEQDVTLGGNFPTLELKSYLPPPMIAEYEAMTRSPDLLPCRHALGNISPLQFASWLSRLAVTRLQRRCDEIFTTLHACRDSWQEAVFRCFITNFGFRTNASAFELLAKSLPYKYLLKHKDSRLQVYALVFGQAGMLEDDPETPDEYYVMLQSEYRYLRYKYRLTPIPVKVWNLLRLRPQNFPCVRLAQLSECLYRIPDLIEQILSFNSIDSLHAISNFEPHPYWKTHLHFGKESPPHQCKIGKQTFNLLIINTVAPVRMAYATFVGNEKAKEQSLSLLETIAFESNNITRQYAEAGFPTDNALYSQAILELYRSCCTPKHCLQCDIGCQILRPC